MPIQLLPISLANQIAAGEVIERPASVVKELIENSLDAGASELVIDIEKGGRRRMRIRDNGAGIAKDELPLALARHATSKITSLADLEAIQSLGFRGEALASISSVARLTLTSKPEQQNQAWRAWVEGRDMTAELAPASHPTGTTIDVEDLFFNTPARRKFLRTDKTEFAHIDELIKRIALSRYDVRITLNHNQKVIRQFPAVTQAQALTRITKVIGRSFSDAAMAIDCAHHDVRLWGWVVPPEACRHQADAQYFYVNGRMMRDRMLNHAIRQAYGDTLTDERSPTYVLYLELPATDVDVNVHPAKHEVRFHQARQMHDFVLQSVRRCLSDRVHPEASHSYQASSETLRQQVAELQPRMAMPLPGVMGKGGAAAAPAPMFPGTAPQLPQKDAAETSTAALPAHDGEVLTVVAQRFALIAHNEPTTELQLLDLQRLEHAYLQQQLIRQYATGLAGQPLLIPVKIADKALSQQLLALAHEQLGKLGVLVQQDGQACVVKQVPSALRHTDIQQSMQQLVDSLGADKQPDSAFWAWLARHSVSTSYRRVQAEHWWRVWQEHFASAAEFSCPMPLPHLPEPLK
ncbi:DNA mismatch repair protein MutL [Pseudidiomarina sediminum]|uniref:DNA mismatch repair protein MutL n=1 Tax=Pseudidiomarina sediminum TaxID=431675 RepID=A0A432ZA04_9GAMM|nr:DNA mismatch repair endonuclease MutL [Pseudidiomarina sediminum]RUO74783.1 DNA mismatch repair protein MutL [Pseudidiomarina sediminum]